MSCCGLPSPGGTDIIELALKLCAFPSGVLLADIGCGAGDCLRYLREHTGCRLAGADKDPDAVKKASACGIDVRCCAAEALPFENGSLDGIIFQCSFSVFEKPQSALQEAYRVLNENGKLIIADFYSRGIETVFPKTIGRVERKEKIILRLQEAGFKLLFFEDCTQSMRELWGQLIFEGTDPETLLGEGSLDRMKAAKCGYGLFIAGKAVCDE
ncbi:MAG: class I SAM-dependent methyltransferase [Synergistes sp.]|nr:class I SAM-dependent methyltransferase [Synergistes sp.]